MFISGLSFVGFGSTSTSGFYRFELNIRRAPRDTFIDPIDSGFTKTPFFIGHTHFCTTNLRIWSFFGQETYIHFVAQETRIITNLFIFLIISSKKVEIDNAKVVFLLELVVIINES